MFTENKKDCTLLRYILKEQNEEEERATRAWIAENPGNRLYFEDFRKRHNQFRFVVLSEAMQGNYSTIRSRMHRHLRLRKLTAIAATVLLLIGIGTGVYLLQHPESTDIPLAESRIHPGSSKAILHLSDGEIVNLDTRDQQLEESDGSTISISAAGLVNYNTIPATRKSAELFHRMEIPRGGEYHLVLSDGTEVWLNSESELQYPTIFTRKERTVMLKGEAYFKVAKNSRSPFIIKINDLDIKVYGTEFNVNMQDNGSIETVLVNGSIGITHGNKEILLHPSQKAEYTPKDKNIVIENVNVLPYIAWKQGNFVFKDESLEKIMEKISKWYNFNVFYSNERVKNIRVFGILKRYEDANELFHYFEKISDVKFIVKGNTVTIQ